MKKLIVVHLALALLVAGSLARAGPFAPLGPHVFPAPDGALPPPYRVPGKEYSDRPDKDATTPVPILDPEQVILWDGAGGVADGYDYSGSRPLDTEEREVDALANRRDVLALEAMADRAHLLFSVTGDGVDTVHYELWGGPPSGGTWAVPPIVDQHYVADLDGLEVWGDDGTSDSICYSLAGDPIVPGTATRTSVWTYVAGPTSVPYIASAALAAAIGRTDLADQIDLDGMMVHDVEGNETFDPGDTIMFTIAPIDVFDGGEIWVWTESGPTAFLVHGGHVWDTPFDVMGTFGLQEENVDALEAVSYVAEPGSLSVLGLAVLALRRRRTA